MKKYIILDDKNWLIEQYISLGKSRTDIAKLIGCGKSTVSRAIDRHGIRKTNTSNCHTSKYPLLNDKAWLYQKYVIEKKSTIVIARIAGAKTCNSARQALKKFNISVRSVSEGLTCCREDDGLVLNDYTKQVIEGGLLGDAGMRTWRKGSPNSNALFYRRNKYYDHVMYCSSQLFKNGDTSRVKEMHEFVGSDKSRPYSIFQFYTLSHESLNAIYEKWYPAANNYIKIVPNDLELSEVSLLHWFMDDGCSHRRIRNGKITDQILISFCSESFSKEENVFLADQMNIKWGLDARVRPIQNGSGWRMHIPQSNAQRFFNVLGDCPVPSMAYKWKLT